MHSVATIAVPHEFETHIVDLLFGIVVVVFLKLTLTFMNGWFLFCHQSFDADRGAPYVRI